MPRINIYEHSDTYSFQVKNLAYACVALPITAIWGPVYDPDEDENPDWLRFAAGYRGTTDFVNTFKGANSAMGARDKSYDYALKLLSAGYDVLVKRADGQGAAAKRQLIFNTTGGVAATVASSIAASATQVPMEFGGVAKEPGTQGNRIKIQILPAVQAEQPKVAYDAETGWSLTEDYRQQFTINIYVALSVPGDADSFTITETDILVESHAITYTWQAGVIDTSTPVEFLEGASNYVSVVKMVAMYAYQSWTGRTEFVCTLGKTATAGTISQSGTAGSGDATMGIFDLKAKYPGSYGNQIKVRIKVGSNAAGKRIGTVEVFDRNGYTSNPTDVIRTDQLLEMQSVAFDINAATDAQPYITDAVFSNLGTINIQNENLLEEGIYTQSLLNGTDYATKGNGIEPTPAIDVQIMNMVTKRFASENSSFPLYIRDQVGNSTTTPEVPAKASPEKVVQIWNQQAVFDNASRMITELTDPLAYDWDALFMGIADDQYIPLSWLEQNPSFTVEYEPTTTHITMLEVAANSKCGVAFIGTPFGMKRGIYNEINGRVTQMTGAIKFMNDLSSAAGPTLSTYGELVGPWCKATLPVNGANSWVTPELAHLLLIINAQGVGGQNKWWMVPAGMLGSGVVHTPEYRIKKAYLDIIQNHDEGVCMNPLMQVPGKGFTCFGNSTLWDKPLGTYNALQNLSTRLLTNRVKQRIWDTALQILFRYNNENAYSHFYAGVSPLLDEMRAVGALTGTDENPWGYRIIMNPDIINLDRINANTVIGKVELAVTGVIDTVDVDLFLLPPTAFQTMS